MDLVDLDLDLWIDFLDWHQTCVVTMDLSVVTGLYQTLFAMTGPNSDVLTGTCSWLGLEPVTALCVWWLGLLAEPAITPGPSCCPCSGAGGAPALLAPPSLLACCPFGSSWPYCALVEGTLNAFEYLCQHAHELVGHKLISLHYKFACSSRKPALMDPGDSSQLHAVKPHVNRMQIYWR